MICDQTERDIEQLRQWIDECAPGRMVFFGGAGVSTESGIPDFRSADGLYAQRYPYPPETMVSRSFFDAHPREFFDFYCGRMLALDAEPNAAHRKLAELEREGTLSAVVTQNIDGLHQKAGSRNVLELHGSVWRNFCMGCGAPYTVERAAGPARAESRRRTALLEVRSHREAGRGAIRGAVGRRHRDRGRARHR